jgi:hypothetical protein
MTTEALPPPPQQEGPQKEDDEVEEPQGSTSLMTSMKLMMAAALLVSAVTTYMNNNNINDSLTFGSSSHRRLTEVGDAIPSYMHDLMEELKERKRLMEETPPQEVKYWFEYTGPLQVSASFV